MAKSRRQEAFELSDRLHSAAIHLLRKLRVEDEASGLSAPRASALSVIVFGGPVTMSELARAEQVSPPTISRLVKELERDGLVRRRTDADDERIQRVEATSEGRSLLVKGRQRRVRKLSSEIERLSPEERERLKESIPIIERLALPERHPRVIRSARAARPRSR
ncbi:MAG TPA: MarR family transcriptional regulator [Vicinamibacteria bacterium]|nr:MarR family transcriptional regulator [Vicinamibacteria bacterium]